MGLTFGIFLYNNVASLDFVGPYEVFTASNFCQQPSRVVTIVEDTSPIQCIGGLKVTPSDTFETAPPLDVLVIPGAEDISCISDNSIDWIKNQTKETKFTASVCTGALILQRAGLLAGRKATTHWMLAEELAKDPQIEVLADMRYVQDGNIVTSQGVSAGIDMALWLLGQLYSPEHAKQVIKFLHYNPRPPFIND